MDAQKFLKAQDADYERALTEIRNGHKQSCWIWYIFPQLKALGRSATAIYYGLENLDDAKDYLAEPVLRERLLEITQALLDLDDDNPVSVMGWDVDALKLRSSMTLFREAEPENPIFQAVLDKYFRGRPDESTLRYLKET